MTSSDFSLIKGKMYDMNLFIADKFPSRQKKKQERQQFDKAMMETVSDSIHYLQTVSTKTHTSFE